MSVGPSRRQHPFTSSAVFIGRVAGTGTPPTSSLSCNFPPAASVQSSKKEATGGLLSDLPPPPHQRSMPGTWIRVSRALSPEPPPPLSDFEKDQRIRTARGRDCLLRPASARRWLAGCDTPVRLSEGWVTPSRSPSRTPASPTTTQRRATHSDPSAPRLRNPPHQSCN